MSLFMVSTLAHLHLELGEEAVAKVVIHEMVKTIVFMCHDVSKYKGQ